MGTSPEQQQQQQQQGVPRNDDDDSNTKYNTCSDYAIPIKNNKKQNKSNDTSSTSSSSSSSSVLDKGVVESRTITDNDGKPKTREDIKQEIQDILRGGSSSSNNSQNNNYNIIVVFLRQEFRSLLSIVMFLTRLVVPIGIDIHPGFIMNGMCYFPVVGTMIGIVEAIVYDVMSITFQLPSSIAACAGTAINWWLTGCFHQDGLSDSADGIGGGWNRKQILKIMTDSRVGVYGCAALILYTITKIQLLSSLNNSMWSFHHLHHHDVFFFFFDDNSNNNNDDDDGGGGNNNYYCRGAGPAIVLSHTLSRLTAPYMIRMWDYIDDEDGPKSSFYNFMIQAKQLVSRQRILFAAIYSLVVATVLVGPYMALALVVVVFLLAQTAGNYGERVLGGVMGDFLGATICLGELLVLTVLLIAQQPQQQVHQDDLVVVWSLVSSFNTTNIMLQINEVITLLPQNDRFLVFGRFVVMYIVYKIWSLYAAATNSYSGSPNDKTGNDKQADQSTTQTQSSTTTTTTPSSSETTNNNGPRVSASNVLSDPTSTFGERYHAVRAYMDGLAKPVGSLGTLEGWAARLAALQRTLKPSTDDVACLIFAGDHGVAAATEHGGEECSAYPQAVTRSVLIGLERGVAGASVLAKANDVHPLKVIDVGVVGGPTLEGKIVRSSPNKLPNGTKNFCSGRAMSAEECERCIRIGRETVKELMEETRANVLALGEVGIGNTTSSSALIAALTNQPADLLCGGGAFATRELQEDVVAKKISIVNKALGRHGYDKNNKSVAAADALANLGGAEIAAMVGALLEASERDIALLVDGFIATAAALVAVTMSPNVCHVLFFTSQSAEKGQQAALVKIQSIAKDHNIPMDEAPVLSMGLRMGEATAALIAVPIVRSSAAVLSDMATIQDILSS